VQLLLLPERRLRLPVQFRVCALQVREHQGRLHDLLHQRRQTVLRPDPGLLRLPGKVLHQRLLLLRVLQWHAGLLRHVLSNRSI
jgi:hypothetical protein